MLFGESEEVCLGAEAKGMNQKDQVSLVLGEQLTNEQQEQIRQLERRFEGVFSLKPGRTDKVKHKIRTSPNLVVRSNLRNWPHHLKEVINKEVQEMLKMGVIEPSKSPWRSHPVLVPKSDGSTRFCIDFRKLNSVSEFDAYPMPKIDNLLEKLGKAQYLSSLDLTKGYWQIPLAEDKEKTAFCTPKGLFHFTYMPFGLHGAAASFQRLMDEVLEPVTHCTAAYIDDIIVFSCTWEEHLKHLGEVLRELRKARLTVNPGKCKIC